MALGKWLAPQARSGKAFLISPSSLAESKDFQDCLNEAIKLRELTRLFVVFDVATRARIVVNSSSIDPKETTRIVDRWDVIRKYGAAAEMEYIGIPYEDAFGHNEKVRKNELAKAPAMATSNDEAWRKYKEAALASTKPSIALAERWARLMQPMLKNGRISTREAVYASLYLADGNGHFTQSRRPTVFRHLQKFWPHFDTTIRKILK